MAFAIILLVCVFLGATSAEMSCKITCDDQGIIEYPAEQGGISVIQGPPGPPGFDGPKGEKGDAGTWTNNRVAFSAGRGEALGPIARDTVIQYNHIFIDIGDSFDRSTGVFTCITPGVYVFLVNVQKRSDTHDTYVELIKNGRLLLSIHDSKGDYLDTSSNSLIINVERGDRIWLQLGQGYILYSSEGRYTTFSGYLIYPEL